MFAIAFVVLFVSCSAVVHAQDACTGTITTGAGSSGIVVPRDSVCRLQGGKVQGQVIVEEGAILRVVGAEIAGTITCQGCFRIRIKDSPSVGGIAMTEVTDGSLTVIDSFFAGTVLVSKTSNTNIALMNACGTQPGAMDILFEEITGKPKTIKVFSMKSPTTGVCVPQCDVGDLLVTKTNVRNIRLGGQDGCKLTMDSDTTIAENSGAVFLTSVNSSGDVALRGNGDVTLRGSFGLEDISVSGNKAVFAKVRNTGSLKFEENESVELVCAVPNKLLGNVEIVKTDAGSVQITDCTLGTLTCVDNTGSVFLDSVTCTLDECDGASC